MSTALIESDPVAIAGVEPSAHDGIGARLWRRRGLFAAVVAAVLGITVLALLVLPTRYVATGSIIVAEPEPGGANQSPVWAQKLGDPADLESQLLLVRSPRILRLAMAQPGVVANARAECQQAIHGAVINIGVLTGASAKTCDSLQPDSEALLEYLEARFSVGSVGRSRVINVAYQSPMPDVAQSMANALIAAFLDDQRNNIAKTRQDAASWIWKEIGRLDLSLRADEAQIQEYRRKYGLARGSTAQITSERLTSVSQQLSNAEVAQAEAAARLQEINADQARGSANSPAVLASRPIADLKQQYTTTTSQLANAATTLGANHPSIQALERERDNIRGRMRAEVASVAASARQVLDASTALVASLKRQLAAAKTEVGAATDAEATIAGMLRSVEQKRGQYSDLYKRASELETERRVLIGSTRLVNLAELPAKPFFPKKLPFLAAGATVALLLGAAAALLRDRTDRSVRAAAPIATATGLATLVRLPRLSAGSFAIRSLVAGRDELPLRLALDRAAADPSVQDALSGLYARLTLAQGGTPLRRLLVTSAAMREGKTFTTLTLARRIAATDRRVLVIECDLRCPAFAGALDLPPSPGLGAVLRGQASYREATLRTGYPNLDVIPAGPPESDSTELLMGRRMTELLAATVGYDLVLLDSPPAGLLMDAFMLAKHVDQVLVCARWGHSQVEATAATIASLRAAGGNVAGLAFTMVRPQAQMLYESRPIPAHPVAGVA